MIMPARFVNLDRQTPLLLPPDLRDWLPDDHLAHYVIEVVDGLDLRQVQVNERGTGDEQFPPRLMLALLIYCYATGTVSSRQIERATYGDVAVRYLCADTPPDHDTICTFRRQNRPLLEESFLRVLERARELKFLKVGQITVAADGTKVLAQASKHAAVSYERAGELILQLQAEVKQLLDKAEKADSTPLADGLTIPAEIARRGQRQAALETARAVIAERARARAEAERADYERKAGERAAKRARGERGGSGSPAARSEATSKRAVQLYRSRESDHESRQRESFRASVQRASGGGGAESVDRGAAGDGRPQRQTAVGTDDRSDSGEGGGRGGSGVGGQRLLQ